MDQSEIKCPKCGKWTPGKNDTCVFCGNLVNPVALDRQERQDRALQREKQRSENLSWMERKLDELRQSESPLARIAFGVLNVVWIVYMGIVSFIIWFTAIFSG